MFNFLKNRNKDKVAETKGKIFVPVDGEVQSLTHASDPIFAQKSMGDGFLVMPSSDKIFAPVSGTVTMVADTKHALTIHSADGADILLHLGIDTVELFGKPFDLKVKKGDTIIAQSPIGTMDIAQIKEADLSPEVLVIFVKSEDVHVDFQLQNGEKKHGEQIGQYTIN
ncbi:MAG: PTS glucose transporter subunit IIA [Oenococcus sp.]|uniref:PTS sugar transporter subunit IIA n=1 Tax=Oenococcus sp. TaxID=1979414 RepID=UPI0039E96F07